MASIFRGSWYSKTNRSKRYYQCISGLYVFCQTPLLLSTLYYFSGIDIPVFVVFAVVIIFVVVLVQLWSLTLLLMYFITVCLSIMCLTKITLSSIAISGLNRSFILFEMFSIVQHASYILWGLIALPFWATHFNMALLVFVNVPKQQQNNASRSYSSPYLICANYFNISRALNSFKLYVD